MRTGTEILTQTEIETETETVETSNDIRSFRGRYGFLSNFHLIPVPFRGLVFPSAEHAYASAKTTNPDDIHRIHLASTPAKAKRIGRNVVCVDNWEDIKLAVMQDVLYSKFTHNPLLGEKLLATGDKLLVEGNTWHDQTWGDCTCEGHRDIPGTNMLGRLLMIVRSILRARQQA